MGEEAKAVKLHTMWGSPFGKRVQMALKMKNIPYEYVEEDTVDKSETLLRINPVYKKVPVLVYEGKPIPESLVILEFIEENWKNPPLLLPGDPFERAKVRFWANFIDTQILEVLRGAALLHGGEEQQKDLLLLSSKMEVLEAGIHKDFFASGGGNQYTGGQTPGLLDIVMCWFFGLPVREAVEEATGITMMEPKKYPLLSTWVAALSELAVVKDIAPPPEDYAALFKKVRGMSVPSSKA